MNTLNFEFVIAYFKASQRKNFYQPLVDFVLRHGSVFEALARTGQPFGGKVY